MESLELGLGVGESSEDVEGGMGRGGGRKVVKCTPAAAESARGCNTGTGQLFALAKRLANSAYWFVVDSSLARSTFMYFTAACMMPFWSVGVPGTPACIMISFRG